MKLPKLAIFDMDGLLFDTERNMYEANTEVMEKYGYQQDFDSYMTTMGMAGDNFFRQLYKIHGPDYPAHEIAAARPSRQGGHPRAPALLPRFRI